MMQLTAWPRLLGVVLVGAGIWLAGGWYADAQEDRAGGQKILALEVDGAIGPATSEYIHSGLRRAANENAALVILRMDTPGGLDTAMRDIIKDILASPVPVATFVAPQGARAASAGTYILYASHVAAMAPGTNLGAATPVNLQGPPTPLPGRAPDLPDSEGPDDEGLEGEGEELPEADGAGEEPGSGEEPAMADKESVPKGDAMSAKAVNDASAYIESLAEMRGRNAEWAVRAVREAASLSATDALEMNVIDLMAADVPELIKRLDGQTVEVGSRKVELGLAGLATEQVEPSWRTELLSIITNPNVALLLMMIGTYGLILEFYNPGSIFPGVVGAISLLLALYALNVLPVNYAGLGLIVLGLALIVAEAFAPSFGILGLGGAAAFVFGALLLFDTESPEFQVSLTSVITMTIVIGGIMVGIMTMAVRAHRRPVASGEESVSGHDVKVIDWAEGHGTVWHHGEHWSATGPASLAPGAMVRVEGRDGLTLKVSETQTEKRS